MLRAAAAELVTLERGASTCLKQRGEEMAGGAGGVEQMSVAGERGAGDVRRLERS